MGTIGENIKNYRTFRGIKQQELADALGKSKSVISNWERGENSPDVEICVELCKTLKVTPNQLFGWEVNPDYEAFLKRMKEYTFRIQKLQAEKEKIEKQIEDLELQKFKEIPEG